MKKSGFTMVELIFVIVIIGILAATAIPKFDNTIDNAKANSEISAMNSLDGSIVAKKEFRFQDFHDNNVIWNDRAIPPNRLYPRLSIYENINDSKSVLKAIMNKGEKFRITGVVSMNESSGNLSYAPNDILLITGPASNPEIGAEFPDAPGDDIAGKPDQNDFWVFNPNIYDLNVSVSTTATTSNVIIAAQSIGLIDVNGTDHVTSDPAYHLSKIKIYEYDGISNISGAANPVDVK